MVGVAVAFQRKHAAREIDRFMPRLYTPREAADMLGISYGTLKGWLYQGELKSFQTPGGHHRIPESQIDRCPSPNDVTDTPELRRRMTQSVSARN